MGYVTAAIEIFKILKMIFIEAVNLAKFLKEKEQAKNSEKLRESKNAKNTKNAFDKLMP